MQSPSSGHQYGQYGGAGKEGIQTYSTAASPVYGGQGSPPMMGELPAAHYAQQQPGTVNYYAPPNGPPPGAVGVGELQTTHYNQGGPGTYYPPPVEAPTHSPTPAWRPAVHEMGAHP
jgi:hypothetical protein